MRNLLAILTIPAITVGCVVYDNDGPGQDDPDVDIARDYEDDDVLDNGDEELGFALEFSPSQAEQGESFIGYITVSDGQGDLNAVTDVKFYGDIAMGSWDSRGDEVILSVSVADDAVEGEVDMIVEMEDGSAIWLEAALTVYPNGSGNSYEDAPEPSDDGQTDDGQTGDGSDDELDDGGDDCE